MPSVPDLLMCDESGKFHMVELKYTKGNSVDLRPHQVSWLTTHSKSSSWVFIKQQKSSTEKAALYLYPASDAIDLKTEGLSKVEPLFTCEAPFDWAKVFSLICPI